MKHQTVRKARERKHRLLEIDRKDIPCHCGLNGNKERRVFRRSPRFSDLPEEIVIEIVSYFSLRDLLRFRQVIQKQYKAMLFRMLYFM